jgi:cation diffusion facilitator family transporter
MPLRLSRVPGPEARAATLSLAVAVLLFALKLVAYWLTGSSAVFSDAMESIVNVVAAGFGMYSLMLAHAPADREHPYGHGKVEFLSATFEGGMILLAALVILWRAIEALLRGPALEQAQPRAAAAGRGDRDQRPSSGYT